MSHRAPINSNQYQQRNAVFEVNYQNQSYNSLDDSKLILKSSGSIDLATNKENLNIIDELEVSKINDCKHLSNQRLIADKIMILLKSTGSQSQSEADLMKV